MNIQDKTRKRKPKPHVGWNMFRDRTTGKLDRRGLRVSAVYRLFMQKHLIEHAVPLVELWIKWPAQKWAVVS